MEKEWLISQQKNAAGTSEKASELAAQLDQTKTELREEKTKVKMIAMMMMVIILVMMMMMVVVMLVMMMTRGGRYDDNVFAAG